MRAPHLFDVLRTHTKRIDALAVGDVVLFGPQSGVGQRAGVVETVTRASDDTYVVVLANMLEGDRMWEFQDVGHMDVDVLATICVQWSRVGA